MADHPVRASDTASIHFALAAGTVFSSPHHTLFYRAGHLLQAGRDFANKVPQLARAGLGGTQATPCSGEQLG